MRAFSSKVKIIGVNPYVLLPAEVLNELFTKSGKDTSPIPVRGNLNGKKFNQTLVKFSGKWRLYLNTPMRKNAEIEVGDIATVDIEFDPEPRTMQMHPKLKTALSKNKKAQTAFEKLPPYRQKEIIRYISFLKSEESINRNITKAIQHLLGKERFVGRN